MLLLTKTLETIVQASKRVIKVLTLGRSASRTAHLVQPWGEDSNPVGWKAIYADTGTTGQPVIIGFINPNVAVAKGEKKIFSTDADGVESTSLYLKADGTMVLGGGADYAVRYSELETAFNTLRTDFNNLVTVYNLHIHTSAAAGSPTTPLLPPNTGISSSADVSGAKVDEIRVP